jgi:hypothetical protein
MSQPAPLKLHAFRIACTAGRQVPATVVLDPTQVNPAPHGCSVGLH